DAYRLHGFYIFENVIKPAELAELLDGTAEMLERAPVTKDAKVDAKGRPALGLDFARPAYYMVKPLSDPHGGTANLGGRHPVQMHQPTPGSDAPKEVVLQMYSMCQAIPAALRL